MSGRGNSGKGKGHQRVSLTAERRVSHKRDHEQEKQPVEDEFKGDENEVKARGLLGNALFRQLKATPTKKKFRKAFVEVGKAGSDDNTTPLNDMPMLIQLRKLDGGLCEKLRGTGPTFDPTLLGLDRPGYLPIPP